MGVTIDVTMLPGERSLVEVNKGACGGEVVRVKGIEETYPNLLRVPVTLVLAEGVAFTKKLTIATRGWESLAPYSIVIRRGLKFAEAGTAALAPALVNTYEETFLLVSIGRYDLCVCDRLTGYYFIKKFGYEDLKALEPPWRHLSSSTICMRSTPVWSPRSRRS